MFLWLLSNNKLLTRDNLSKRRPMADVTCVFCSENESIVHLFFECCVAKEVWSSCANSLGISLNPGFESIARLWIYKKKHAITNLCTSAILWCIWNLRNAFCFQGKCWRDVPIVLTKACRMMRRWKSLCNGQESMQLHKMVEEIEGIARQPLRISWGHQASWDVQQRQDLEGKGAVASSTFGAHATSECFGSRTVYRSNGCLEGAGCA